MMGWEDGPPPGWDEGDAATGKPSAPRSLRVVDSSDWQAALLRKKNGEVYANAANAAIYLVHSGEWSIRWDELSGEAVFDKVPPVAGMGKSRLGRIDDYAVAYVRAWLARVFGGKEPTKELTCEAIDMAAKQNRFSPIREYLEGLTWDGVPRVATWLRDYLGASVTPAMANAGRMWLISGVARAMVPGSKVDHMLVLEGGQGDRKTTALETLFGSAWFLDSVPDLTNKDSQVMLAGKWGACMDELHAMRSDKLSELIKNYLTRRTDKYRPPYSRHQIDQPRTVIFCGTTNQSQYLHDPSGSRRFWPVTVGKVDVDAIARDRDQLWAEALSEYMDGKQWWPDAEMSASIAETNLDRQHHDEWHTAVEKFCSTKVSVSISEILRSFGFQFEANIDRAAQMRVAKILQEIGWVRIRRRSLDGTRAYLYSPQKIATEQERDEE